MKGTALVPRCGPCQQDMESIQAITAPGAPPTPAWWCPKCRAWTPRRSISPYRKG